MPLFTDSRLKLRDIINSSSLLPEEKNSLLVLFSRATEAEIKNVVELLSQKPELVNFIYKNFQLKAQDPIPWDQILQEEEQLLNIL